MFEKGQNQLFPWGSNIKVCYLYFSYKACGFSWPKITLLGKKASGDDAKNQTFAIQFSKETHFQCFHGPAFDIDLL